MSIMWITKDSMENGDTVGESQATFLETKKTKGTCHHMWDDWHFKA